MAFIHNAGRADRWLRMAVGLLLLVVGFLVDLEAVWLVGIFAIAIVLLGTALVR